jgi:transglutaminase/protease-like cytokinesis protein 3
MIRITTLIIGATMLLTVARSQSADFQFSEFRQADSIADRYYNHDLKDQEELTKLLTKDLKSDLEKFRVIFKWIANNISYDISMAQEKKKKERELRYDKRKFQKWEKRFQKEMIRKLILGKETICSGYSSLLETMCGYAGITCEVISGYGRNESEKIGSGALDHAWNAVFIDSKWYLCDPTWASGYVNEEFNTYRRRFNTNYFLADPDMFALDHYPKNKDWLLTVNRLTLKEFLNSPHKSSGFIAYKLNHYRPTEGRIKIKSDSSTIFAFTTNLPVDSIKTVTVNVYKLAKHSYHFKNAEDHQLSLNSEGYYNFAHQLKDKGLFLFRIYIGRKLALTYELESK